MNCFIFCDARIFLALSGYSYLCSLKAQMCFFSLLYVVNLLIIETGDKMRKINLTYKNILLYVISFGIIVGGDQITKIIVDHTLSLGASYSIIDSFFYFTYSHNDGAAWGIFSGKLELFFVIAIVAAVGLIYYFIQSEAYQKLTRFGIVLIFSGMIGNLIDRVCLGYVRDFIDFIIFGYDFPIFNVADMAITIGFILVIIEVGIEEYKAWKISKSEL